MRTSSTTRSRSLRHRASLTPPLEGLAGGEVESEQTSQPATSRPFIGTVQPIAIEPVAVPSADQVETVYQEGVQAWQGGDLLKARDALNRVLHAAIPAERQAQIREVLNQIAEKTIFAPFVILPGETMAEDYVVVQNDNLQKIGRIYKVTEELLSVVNGNMNKNVIRTGRRLKVVKGPFHATVVKSSFEMHLYLQHVYGQRIAASDPQNPLGEFWIALDGIEGRALGQSGYGIHGTIDDSSIGTQASMGCVRLSSKDIEVVYAMLVPGSTVTITD